MGKPKCKAWDGFRMTTSGIQFNSSTGELEFAPDGVLIQCAGLFDKNGVEAWAGDIVKIPDKGNYEVIFKEGCFGFKGKISDIVYRAQFEWYSYEIIGNKHQHPELLEG